MRSYSLLTPQQAHRVGVAIGDYVLDLTAVKDLFDADLAAKAIVGQVISHLIRVLNTDTFSQYKLKRCLKIACCCSVNFLHPSPSDDFERFDGCRQSSMDPVQEHTQEDPLCGRGCAEGQRSPQSSVSNVP